MTKCSKNLETLKLVLSFQERQILQNKHRATKIIRTNRIILKVSSRRKGKEFRILQIYLRWQLIFRLLFMDLNRRGANNKFGYLEFFKVSQENKKENKFRKFNIKFWNMTFGVISVSAHKPELQEDF